MTFLKKKKDFQAVFQIYDQIQRNDNSSNCENELKNWNPQRNAIIKVFHVSRRVLDLRPLRRPSCRQDEKLSDAHDKIPPSPPRFFLDE